MQCLSLDVEKIAHYMPSHGNRRFIHPLVCHRCTWLRGDSVLADLPCSVPPIHYGCYLCWAGMSLLASCLCVCEYVCDGPLHAATICHEELLIHSWECLQGDISLEQGWHLRYVLVEDGTQWCETKYHLLACYLIKLKLKLLLFKFPQKWI